MSWDGFKIMVFFSPKTNGCCQNEWSTRKSTIEITLWPMGENFVFFGLFF